MKTVSLAILCPLIIFNLSACGWLSKSQNDWKNKNIQAEVIYGPDNRKDFFQESDPDWQKLAQSTVALFNYDDLEFDEAQKVYRIKAETFGVANNLCQDEAFYQQPSAAFCSGFLIGPDIVITAGHCIRNQYNCEDVRFVFGYAFQTPQSSPLQVSQDSVYLCQDIIHTQANALNGSDFAVLRLKTKVKNFSPLPVRIQGQINMDSPLTVIGYPSGLPGKIAHGGLIRTNNDPHFFVTSLDTYGGNSGSAVFNTDSREVEGILVRGDYDFSYDQDRKCRTSHRCQQDGCRGEDVVRISEALKYLTEKDLQPLPGQ